MKGKSLGEARKLYRARKFPEVIRVLEPEVFRFRESFEYFCLLGFSCLHTGDVGGAFSYISRARHLDEDNVDVILGLAAIHLRKVETEDAIKLWLRVLEIEPSNRIARRGLDLLRRGLPPDGLQELIDSGKLKQLYPRLASRLRLGLVLAIPLAVLALGCLGYLGYRVTRPAASNRPGVTGIEIPSDLPRLIDSGSDFTFIFTEREVKQLFNKAKSELLGYRDNLAAVDVNRILLSNAAPAIKERARMLKGFVMQPTFDTLRDAFSYATVAAQPALYDGCAVSWRGKAANVKAGKTAMTFDLLVGYDQEKELEGIVGVTLPFAAQLENGANLDVLGEVIVQTASDAAPAAPGQNARGAKANAPSGGPPKLSLLGISLHKLAAQ
jgi:hypothetical protein